MTRQGRQDPATSAPVYLLSTASPEKPPPDQSLQDRLLEAQREGDRIWPLFNGCYCGMGYHELAPWGGIERRKGFR